MSARVQKQDVFSRYGPQARAVLEGLSDATELLRYADIALYEAKAAGNYAATLQPVQEARALGFDQILWTDGIEFKYLQEIGTMNVFLQIDGKVITPALNGCILNGITRNSLLQLIS